MGGSLLTEVSHAARKWERGERPLPASGRFFDVLSSTILDEAKPVLKYRFFVTLVTHLLHMSRFIDCWNHCEPTLQNRNGVFPWEFTLQPSYKIYNFKSKESLYRELTNLQTCCAKCSDHLSWSWSHTKGSFRPYLRSQTFRGFRQADEWLFCEFAMLWNVRHLNWTKLQVFPHIIVWTDVIFKWKFCQGHILRD